MYNKVPVLPQDEIPSNRTKFPDIASLTPGSYI